MGKATQDIARKATQAQSNMLMVDKTLMLEQWEDLANADWMEIDPAELSENDEDTFIGLYYMAKGLEKIGATDPDTSELSAVAQKLRKAMEKNPNIPQMLMIDAVEMESRQVMGFEILAIAHKGLEQGIFQPAESAYCEEDDETLLNLNSPNVWHNPEYKPAA